MPGRSHLEHWQRATWARSEQLTCRKPSVDAVQTLEWALQPQSRAMPLPMFSAHGWMLLRKESHPCWCTSYQGLLYGLLVVFISAAFWSFSPVLSVRKRVKAKCAHYGGREGWNFFQRTAFSGPQGQRPPCSQSWSRWWRQLLTFQCYVYAFSGRIVQEPEISSLKAII